MADNTPRTPEGSQQHPSSAVTLGSISTSLDAAPGVNTSTADNNHSIDTAMSDADHADKGPADGNG